MAKNMKENGGDFSFKKRFTGGVENADPLEINKALFGNQMKEAAAKNAGGKKKETYNKKEQKDAKKFVDEVQAKQEYITAAMKEWNETNKFKNVEPLAKVQKNLDTALKLSPEIATWSGIADAKQIEHSAVAAEYLCNVAKLPKDLAEDPNVLFQYTARFAASMSEDGPAYREEVQILDKAILRIRELRENHPAAGFTLNNEDLTYTLRGAVLYDAVLDPTSDIHAAAFLAKFQREIDNRGAISAEQKLREWNDMGKLLTKAISVELDPDGGKKTYEVKIEELTKYIDRVNRKAKELKVENNQEKQKEYKENTLHVKYEEVSGTLPPNERTHTAERTGQMFKFRDDIWTVEQVELLKEGPDGLKQVFYEFIEDLDGMGKSHDRPSLPEQEYWNEIERYAKWLYQDNTKAHLEQFQYVWKEHERLSMIVKNLLFQPGDLKDRIKNLQYLTPADMDHFIHDTEWASQATQLYEEVVCEFLSRERMKYDNVYTKLTTAGVDGVAPIKRFQDLISWRNKGYQISDTEIEVRAGKPISQLNTEDIAKYRSQILATKEREYAELEQQVNIVGQGVMLWDKDVQNNAEIQIEIYNMNQKLDLLKEKKLSGTLTEWEEGQYKTLEKKIKFKDEIILERKGRSDLNDLNKELHESSGLSPIDLEVRERLMSMFKLRGNEAVPEWQIRRAIWAARQHMIGSGRMFDIGSSLVTRPAYELKDLYKGIDIGKYVMRSPAFEDLQRIVNPDMFQDRFTNASESGNIFRARTTIGFLEKKGFVFRGDERYVRAIEKGLDPEIRTSREFLRQIREETGIPFTETITQGLFMGGGMLDQSQWRGQLCIIDAIQQYRLAQGLPIDARLENQAIGIRIASSKPGKGRQELIERLIERNPGKLMQLLGTPVDEVLKANGWGQDEKGKINKNVLILQKALSLSTVRVVEEEAFVTRDLHLMTNRNDFDAVVMPLLKNEGMSDIDIETSFKILQELKGKFVADRKEKGMTSMIEAWSHFDFPLTITTSDINWEEVDFSMMGNTGPDRRGRDLFNMAMARDAWGKLEDPALLYHKDPKEVLKIIKEFREAMNHYTSGGAAEDMTLELVKAWIDMNRNQRTESVFDPTMWIPFAGAAMKAVGSLNVGWVDTLMKTVGFKAWEGDPNKFQNFLRNKITGRLSYAARFTGPNANAWEEKEIDKVLDELLGMGIFNTNEMSYLKLRNQKKAGLIRQIFGLVRKNWWLIPLATAAMATTSSIEEEKKK